VALARPRCPLHGFTPLPPGADPDTRELTHVEPQRFPGYRTLRVIGHGGFGTVYAAEPESGGAPVAIKLAHVDPPDAGLRLVHEIAVLSDVGPPHVPAVYGSGELSNGSPYVAMELVDAPTLAERLVGRRDPIPLAEAKRIALAILRALAAVHARGWVHRDLKPENVFVDELGKGAKIVDFGLVAAGAAPEGSTCADAAGTAEYMAPEQCERSGEVDVRADIYAMGVILYEMLSGAPPFWGPLAKVQEAHRSLRPPRLSGVVVGATVPREIDEIVHRCLAKDRRDRFPSAAALGAALEELSARALTTAQVPARPTDPPPSVTPAPASARDQRRRMGLLFFEAELDVIALQRRLLSSGGQLAHGSGGQFVVVFGHDLGDNPVRPALFAAHSLIREGVTDRVRLDVGAVSVQTRADGSKRFLSPVFAKRDRFPAPVDPPGVSLTPAAEELLSEPGGPVSAASSRPAIGAPSGETTSGQAETGGMETLVGRDEVVEALVASAQRAIGERASTLVRVIAEPGHGKSHLFRVLVRRLRKVELRAEVIDLRAIEPALGGVDHTVKELLQRTLDLPDTPPFDGGALLRERLGRCGAADAAPVVAVALGWTAIEAPGPSLGSGLRTLTAAPGALRSALIAAAAGALRKRAENRPIVLLVDDAHHADEVTLAALEYAALAEAHATLWICCFARPSFDAAHPEWGSRAEHQEAFRLEPLDYPRAAELCRKLLLPIENVPDSAVERLVERTQGIPLLLVELVRGLRREGLVRRTPKGDGYYLATDELDRLPDLPLVEWQAQGELDALPEALKAHARLVALLGEEVSIADTAGVLRRLEEQGAGAELPLDGKVGTRELINAGLLVESKTGRISFRHSLIREAIAKGVPEALRRRVHLAAVVHYLEAQAGADVDRRLAQLAFHAAQAGLGAVAEGAYLDLAERMRARHAYLPAERYYSRALELPSATGDLRRLAAYRGRGLMRYRVARYHDALADLSTAREMAHQKGDLEAEVDILLDEATVLDWVEEFKSSEERVEEARRLATALRSPAIEARLLLGIGRSRHRFSNEEEAAALLERAAASAAALGDEGYETLVIALIVLGFILQGLGRLDDARARLDRAIALAETHGDDLHLAVATNNRAVLWSSLGDRRRMLADMERGLALARKLGLSLVEFASQANLGECLYWMDEADAAEPHVRRAAELERQRAGDAVRPTTALLEARLLYFRGDEEDAGAVVERIRAHQVAARAAGNTDQLMVPSEEVLCDAIAHALAGADEAAWDELEERAARFSVGQERIEVLEARAVAALRRGRASEAVARMERALALAERIPNAMGARLARRLAEAKAAARASRSASAPPPP
jgi:serine/threonine protein kinase/tetratricopeptide (TPR) repeat protein